MTLIYTDYEQKILDYISRLTVTSTLGAIQNQRVVLGGVTGSGGGHGGPIQPFIGKLTQTSVCYDTSEFAKIAMPTGTSASLLDNLNHIRAGYSIKPLYTPTNYYVPSGQDSTLLHHLAGLDLVASGFAGHTIQDEGVDLPTETYLNFIGDLVTVTDNPGNNATDVTFDIPAGAGWPFSAYTVDPGGDADYTTMAYVVEDLATAGDAILVGPGVYVEDFSIPAGVALVGLAGNNVRISGCVTLGSGVLFENFEVSASGCHALIIPAGTSGADIINIDARTTGLNYYALSASGNARVTHGKYSTYGNPGGLGSDSTTIESSKDAWLEEANGDDNYGGKASITVGVANPNYLSHGVMYFDLSSVNGEITSASLNMNSPGGAGTFAVVIYRILAANDGWVEGTDDGNPEVGSVCWNKRVYNTTNWAGSAGCSTAETDFYGTYLGIDDRNWNPGEAGVGWVEITLDAAEIEKMRNGTHTNAGFLLLGDETSGNYYAFFYTSESSGHEPYLSLEFSTEIPQTKTAHPVSTWDGNTLLLDDPEILGSGIEGDGWQGVWYDEQRNVNIKNLVEH